MTIPEAAELVLQAGSMGTGGDVFVLDMGEPVKILDLPKRMIHLMGLKERDDDHPDSDVDIRFVGLCPGEKLYEELLIGDNVGAQARCPRSGWHRAGGEIAGAYAVALRGAPSSCGTGRPSSGAYPLRQ
jgi:FlaA1/EpsC-like NDP-sugar epimerase